MVDSEGACALEIWVARDRGSRDNGCFVMGSEVYESILVLRFVDNGAHFSSSLHHHQRCRQPSIEVSWRDRIGRFICSVRHVGGAASLYMPHTVYNSLYRQYIRASCQRVLCHPV